MTRARLPVSVYRSPGLEFGCGPFMVSDRMDLEGAVGPVMPEEDRFVALLQVMNRSVALWRIERTCELEPTSRQVLGSMAPVARSARALADALAAAQPAERDGESDPLAGYESDLDWGFERLYWQFARLYEAQEAGKDIFNGPDEAFAQLIGLVQVLASAAECHCRELRLDESERRSAQAASSANHRLFVRLIPVYEELSGRSLGRSVNVRPAPDGADPKPIPTGPAVGFFGFVFARLLGDEAPKPNTIATWIQHQGEGRGAPE